MSAHTSPAPVARRIAAIAFASVMALTAVPAFADIVVYWNVWGTTLRVGTVATTTGFAQTEDGGFHATNESKGTESHMAIVCESGKCGIVDDCTACHMTPKKATTFTTRVAEQHRRTHFPRATMTVGPTAVAFDGGFVRQEAGRLVLLDRNQTPKYRLPTGARLIRDTRTSQPLFVVYDGRTAPEPVIR